MKQKTRAAVAISFMQATSKPLRLLGAVGRSVAVGLRVHGLLLCHHSKYAAYYQGSWFWRMIAVREKERG